MLANSPLSSWWNYFYNILTKIKKWVLIWKYIINKHDTRFVTVFNKTITYLFVYTNTCTHKRIQKINCFVTLEKTKTSLVSTFLLILWNTDELTLILSNKRLETSEALLIYCVINKHQHLERKQLLFYLVLFILS